MERMAVQVTVSIFSLLVLSAEGLRSAGFYGRTSVSSSSANSSLSAGEIVGIVVGIVCGTVLLIVLLWILKRVCRRQIKPTAAPATPGQIISYSSNNNGVIQPTPCATQATITATQTSWPAHQDTKGGYYESTFIGTTEGSLSYSSPFGNELITSQTKAGWQ